MKLYTNIGTDGWGEYFIASLKELREWYKSESEYKNFDEFLSEFNELDKNLQFDYTTNVRNNICRVTVKIDNKKNHNLIDYDEEIL